MVTEKNIQLVFLKGIINLVSERNLELVIERNFQLGHCTEGIVEVVTESNFQLGHLEEFSVCHLDKYSLRDLSSVTTSNASQ